MFGSFMAEGERPNYGITKPVNTYNPITLVFHEWYDIIKDLKQAETKKEAFKILFGRPDDEVIKKREMRRKEAVENALKNKPAPPPKPVMTDKEALLLQKEK